jgi:hypothetical protein
LLGYIVANREHPAVGIYEKVELSFFSESLCLESDAEKPCCECAQITSGRRKGDTELLAESK